MRVTIVFGSSSDKPVYGRIAEYLKGKGHKVSVRVCSAHRTPERLRAIVEDAPDVFIAGAGLAAHLPGVVAAHTLIPVFGVAVPANYEGLDSWLSIAQMPPGVPVVAVPNGEIANSLLGPFDHVVIESGKGKPVDRANALAGLLQVPKEGKKGIKVTFGKAEGNAICVPVAEGTRAEDAAFMFSEFGSVASVGVGRGDNAVIAAAQMIASFTKNAALIERLQIFRKDQAAKIVAADEEEQKWR